jgi:hypothetical protein
MFSKFSQVFLSSQNGSRCRSFFLDLAQKQSRLFAVDFADTLQ